MNRKLVASIAGGTTLVIAAYFASPLLAFHNLREAGQQGDRDGLEATVDFPLLRMNLKSDLNAAMLLNLQKDTALQSNPFGGLAMLVAPALIDRMVDAYLTPESISLMVTNAKVPAPQPGAAVQNRSEGAAHLTIRSGYATLDRFRTTLVNDAAPDKPLSLLFERRGLFAWKLVRIEMPPKLLQ